MELSAFAHLTRRNVKVIQPGLVYVIEWSSGGDLSPPASTPSTLPGVGDDDSDDDPELNERERRRAKREKKKGREKAPVSAPHDEGEDEEGGVLGTVYVACVFPPFSSSPQSNLFPAYIDTTTGNTFLLSGT